MTTLRRLLAMALSVHGAIHLIGVAVTWELADFDDFQYSTEVIGGLDLGTAGIRTLGIIWLGATLAFVVAGFGLLRSKSWAFQALVTATALSSLACLIQVDSAWRGLAIDLVIMLCIAICLVFRFMQSNDREVTR